MAIVSLSELIGQPDVSAFLQGVVAGGRYGNAYLFHGPAGVGKGTAALAFARAMLCEHGAPRVPKAPGLFDLAPAAAAPAGPANDACGKCSACLKAASLQHPDLKFIFPVSGEGKEQEELIADTWEGIRNDPLFVFKYDKAASIRLSITRDLLRDLAYKPFEAARRVVVVRDADRMREDQYSAMLKAIEEPASTTSWILTTSRLTRLPATIRSRCQKVRFAALPEEMVRTFLETRAGQGEKAARMLAALAGGSLARALVLRDLDPRAERDAALALLTPALRGDAAALWTAAQKATRYGKSGREALRRMAEFHQLWLRDLLRARYGAAREDLVNRDLETEVRRQAEGVDATEIRRRLMVLEEMVRAIEGNVSADAAIFSGLLRVSGARPGEGEWPRHATARWDY